MVLKELFFLLKHEGKVIHNELSYVLTTFSEILIYYLVELIYVLRLVLHADFFEHLEQITQSNDPLCLTNAQLTVEAVANQIFLHFRQLIPERKDYVHQQLFSSHLLFSSRSTDYIRLE